MSNIKREILAANKIYAASFGDKADLPMPPGRGFAILTCMDARLDPAKYAGLAEGDAHVIRNAGGRASDGRPPKLMRRDEERQPVSARELALNLPPTRYKTIAWREGACETLSSRFARVRARAAHRDYNLTEARPEEWLLIEWPEEEPEPTKYWLSTLPLN